ncbi:MAG: NADH-quinone oxidoreductase subunit H [Sedimentisphaerales bacterium]|nr:NADH-quinone oxidoreductase subunit H [Sedimentisphaerales bacterium]
MSLFTVLFWILVLPVTIVLGLVASWIVRKVSALVQWRVGPPLFQPAYDVMKLMGKEILIPEQANKSVFMMAPLVGLMGVLLLSLVLWNALATQKTFVGDVIVAIYLMVLPSLALILGGSSSASPHASIGTAREMKLVMGYELPLVLAFIVVLIKTGGELSLTGISQQVPVLSISGMLSFIVALLCVQAKLGFVPFDIAEAETELGSGILMEYSGALLALWKVMHAVMLVTLPFFLMILFLGGYGTNHLTGVGAIAAFVFLVIFVAGRYMSERSKLMDVIALLSFIIVCILAGLGKYVLILVLLILIKNTNPRLRIDQAMKFFWGICTITLVIAIILASLGNYYGIGWL